MGNEELKRYRIIGYDWLDERDPEGSWVHYSDAAAALKAAEAEASLFSDQSNNFQDRLMDAEADLAAVRAENDRLQKLVRSAYNEGFIEGGQENTPRGGKPWQDSRARALLAGKAIT